MAGARWSVAMAVIVIGCGMLGRTIGLLVLPQAPHPPVQELRGEALYRSLVITARLICYLRAACDAVYAEPAQCSSIQQYEAEYAQLAALYDGWAMTEGRPSAPSLQHMQALYCGDYRSQGRLGDDK